MRIIIAGSRDCRDFNDYAQVEETCNKLIGQSTDVEIISGDAL